MHNSASRANRLRATARVHTAVFYGATLDSRSSAALAHRRPAVLAGRLSAVLARLLYAMLAGGQPCCASDSPQQPPLLLGSLLPAPYPAQTGSQAECREPEPRPPAPVRTVSMHTMALRPSSVPQHVALPSPPASSLPELVDFAATCRLDYVTSLVSEFESVCPPSVGGELALGCDILEDRQFELECLAVVLPPSLPCALTQRRLR
ncbi:unnamed protein product, partial [Closterium sp. NIES-53]